MGKKVTFSSVVWKEENLHVAWCPDLDIASQGKSVEEALSNLKEAIELYFEDEEAVIPEHKTTPIVTTLSVEAHAKTTRSLGSRSS